MNLNTHDGGRNLMPVVVVGQGINATRSPCPTNCRASIPPLLICTAEPRAMAHPLRAAHPLPEIAVFDGGHLFHDKDNRL